MNIFYLSLLFQSVLSNCCLNCASTIQDTNNSTRSNCSICLSPYNLYKFSCVQNCGHGYTSISSTCVVYGPSLTFIQTYFNTINDYSLNKVGQFKTQDQSAFVIKGNFMPTVDRGFYSDALSNLLGEDLWIPTTDFSIQLYFWPLATSGVILQILNTLPYPFLNIYMTNQVINVNVYTISQFNQSTGIINGYSSLVDQGTWANTLISIQQSDSTTITIQVTVNGIQTIQSFDNLELYIYNTNQWYLGDVNRKNTLSGFYYILIVSNFINHTSLADPLWVAFCNTTEYRDYFHGCLNCDSNCSIQTSCINNYSCKECYSAQCSNCNGSYLTQCNECTNNQAAPFCCGLFCIDCVDHDTCKKCDDRYYFYNGTCLSYYPYGGNVSKTTPIISILFDKPFSGTYSLLKTGSSSQNYYFFNSPSIDDPIPSKNRGLYFKPGSLLANLDSIFFPHVFSVAFLVKPTGTSFMNVIMIGNDLILQPFGTVLTMNAQTDDSNHTFQSSGSIDQYSTWMFLSVSVKYLWPFSTISVFTNGILSSAKSISGLLRVTSGNFFIGSTRSSLTPNNQLFTGFVYSLYVWNIPIHDFSVYSSFTLCSDVIQTSCLWDCDIDKYLSNGQYLNCNNCSLGCTNGISCNVCLDQLCDVCLDFESSCEKCNANASNSTGVCQCKSQYFANNSDCLACDKSCDSCYGEYKMNCLSCVDSTNVLMNGMCLYKCPDGFAQIGQECSPTDYVVINVVFYKENQYGKISNVVIGSSSLQDSNDPIPSQDRGYYFNHFSGIKKLNTMLNSQFSLNFWIKTYADGEFFCKESMFSLNISQGLVFLYANNILTSFQSTYNTWNYYSFVLTGLPNNYSQFTFYLNTVSQGLFLIDPSNTFYTIPSTLIVGNYTGQGFAGFIWSILFLNHANIINYFSQSCDGKCSFCPTQNICPDDCAYEYLPNTCYGVLCTSGCSACTTSTNCVQCYHIGILINGSCFCPDRYIWNNFTLKCEFECFDSCASCNHFNFQGCLSCNEGFYLINDVCVECPSGYFVLNNRCFISQSLVFNLTFTTASGIVVDSASNISGTTGKSGKFYPDYDEDEPYFAIGRGFYFNGLGSSVNFVNSRLMLAPEFTFEVWFMPISYNGVIISKQINESTVFEFLLINEEIYATFFEARFEQVNFALNVNSSLYQWNNFRFLSKSYGNCDFEFLIYLNSQVSVVSNLYKTYIMDSLASSIVTIGAHRLQKSINLSFASFFSGFIYKILIYNSYLVYSGSNQCLDSCEACFATGQCLPICNISEYWNGFAYNNCSQCSNNCKTGCKDSRPSCLLCDDILCTKCSNLSVCETCKDGASLANGFCQCLSQYTNKIYECEFCDGYVVNNICYSCDLKCLSCSLSGCVSCTNIS